MNFVKFVKKGHPWRQCPKLNQRKSEPDFKKMFQNMVSEADQRYCVRCFTRGHEEEDCPKKQKKTENHSQFKSQREQDMAKFLKAKQSEMKNIVVEEETSRKENRFSRFKIVKRKAPDPDPVSKKRKIEKPQEASDQNVEDSRREPMISPQKKIVKKRKPKPASSDSEEPEENNPLANALGYGGSSDESSDTSSD